MSEKKEMCIRDSDAPYMKEYEHPIWTAYHEIGERGGHGGMDFLVCLLYTSRCV